MALVMGYGLLFEGGCGRLVEGDGGRRILAEGPEGTKGVVEGFEADGRADYAARGAWMAGCRGFEG